MRIIQVLLDQFRYGNYPPDALYVAFEFQCVESEELYLFEFCMQIEKVTLKIRTFFQELCFADLKTVRSF